jgi:2'-5' RNA ligase
MLIALDIAILLPPAVSRRAIELSAALPEAESQGLRLGADCLPHITLAQQFVLADSLEAVLASVAAVVGKQGPLRLAVTGGGRGRSAVWMSVERAPQLVDLHVRLMDALERFECGGGTEAAFVDGDARSRDVAWVTGYRRDSSYASFAPHVTLGHASAPPVVEPQTFEADTIAACHLGRSCSCRRVLSRWRAGRGG